MATWWRVNWWSDEPEAVEAESRGDACYPSKAEAVGVIVVSARARVALARRTLAEAEEKEAKIRDRYPDAPEWDTPL